MNAIVSGTTSSPSHRFPSRVCFVGWVLVAGPLLGLVPLGALCAGPTPQPAAPPVGFVRVTVPSNGYALVSLPFEPFDPSIQAVLRGQLTGAADSSMADHVLFWRREAQEYAPVWRATGTPDPALDDRWLEGVGDAAVPSVRTLAPGDAFWLESRQPRDQQVFLSGRVPLYPEAFTPVRPGYTLLGSPFSSSLDLNRSSLAESGAWAAGPPDWIECDAILRWRQYEGSPYGYEWYTLWDADPESDWMAGWYGGDFLAPTTDHLRIGEGFWYDRKATETFLWTQTRPYDGVFGVVGTRPHISEVSINTVPPSASLSITAQAGVDGVVDVMALDVARDGRFTEKGWAHAARLRTGGAASIVWTDTPTADRRSVADAEVRFYLVARADADADRDGLSDALETHVYGTDPVLDDSDGDGLPDGWEVEHKLNPRDRTDAVRDSDGDGLTNLRECGYGTDPRNADSDGDGLADGREVAWGRLVAWGRNHYGQTNVPPSATNVVAEAAGWYHNLALRADGAVVAWGNNINSQCAVPTSITNAAAVAAGANHSLALQSNGSVVAWGYNWYNQCTVPAAATGVVAIAAGGHTSLALRSDGSVVGWGYDSAGQRSGATNIAGAVVIAAGYTHGLAALSNGTVKAWGSDQYGQRSGATKVTNAVAVAAGYYHSLALRSDGTVVAWGRNNCGQCTVPQFATNVVAIAAGGDYSLALLADRTVKAWGYNYYGECAGATNAVGVASVVGGYNHGLARRHLDPANPDTDRDGMTDGWEVRQGFDPFAATDAALDADADGLSNVAEFGRGTNPKSVDSDGDGARDGEELAHGTDPCKADTDGDGLPDGWEFLRGLDPLSPADAAVDSDGDGLVNSQEHRFGTDPHKTDTDDDGLEDGREVAWRGVAAWGRNNSGQCTVPTFATNAVAVAAGYEHGLALLANRTVVAWGYNGYGQCNVPASATNVLAVAAGYFLSLAVRADGTAVAWGENRYGLCSGAASVRGAKAVACGYEHSLALLADGRVMAWGGNSYGQGNVPASATNAVAVATTRFHSLALRSDGGVVAWGFNGYGQCNVPTSVTNAVAVAAGLWHSLALLSDGRVVGWGYNSNGQCAVPASVTNAVAIAAGTYHSLAVLADGRVVGWGHNGYGQAAAPAWLRATSLAAGDVFNLACGYPDPTKADTDGDGLPDGWEVRHRLNPLAPADAALDSDNDELSNLREYALGTVPRNADTDGDELSDGVEVNELGTSPLLQDSDADGLPDGWDVRHRLDPRSNSDAVVDVDADGLTNAQEFTRRTDPNNPDTDGDGLRDGDEIARATDPLSTDTDGDGLPDGWEVARGLNPLDRSDAALDPDGDDLANLEEFRFGTTFNDPDSDDDGVRDGAEVGWRGVVAWGTDWYGQCAVPMGLTDAVAVTTGEGHSLALRADGTVAAWGADWYGQCSRTPSIPNAVAVVAGAYHSLALLKDGRVTAWGADWYGQCAGATNVTGAKSVAAGAYHSLAVRGDGTVAAWGADWYYLCSGAVHASGATAVAAGYYHSMALRSDGRIVVWGYNGYGQCAVPDSVTNAVAIAAGGYHSLALLADGRVVAWGCNGDGQSTVPSSVTNAVAVAAGAYHSMALLADGRIVGWGANWYGQAAPPMGLRAAAIAAGTCHGLALAFLDPLHPDSDRDGLLDGDESSVHGTNPLSSDTDNDGLSDSDELFVHFTDPLNSDSDGDDLPDAWEIQHGLDPWRDDAALDPDGDELSNLEEYSWTTDPTDSDTDDDDLSDGAEVDTHGTDPLSWDTDCDGLSDGEEAVQHRTDPLNWDTDWDNLGDGEELLGFGTDPFVQDTDGDGLIDGDEVWGYGTNPLAWDTDGDGLSDGDEVWYYGTNPSAYDSDYDGLEDNYEVLLFCTDPWNPDTDGDGLLDVEEVNAFGGFWTDPLSWDTDGDGLSDGTEALELGTSPCYRDTDGDGVDDGTEAMLWGLNPLDGRDAMADPDGDRIPTAYELYWGSDPTDTQSLPPEQAFLYVDGVSAATPQNGSETAPWTDLQYTLDAAPDFGIVRIAAGTYKGAFVLPSDGRCMIVEAWDSTHPPLLVGDTTAGFAVLSLDWSDRRTLIRRLVLRQHASTWDYVAAIAVGSWYGPPTGPTLDSLVVLCSAAVDGYAIGLESYSASCRIVNSITHVPANGMGVYAYGCGYEYDHLARLPLEIESCTFLCAPGAVGVEAVGAGWYAAAVGFVVVSDCVVAGAQSTAVRLASGNPYVSLARCRFQGPVEGPVASSDDVQFLDPKLSLSGEPLPGSSCIDAAGSEAPPVDLLGRSRRDDLGAPNANGSVADIGAVEAVGDGGSALAGLFDSVAGDDDMAAMWLSWDSDNDGLPDYLELRSGLNPMVPDNPAADPDGDGLSNFEEIVYGTHAYNPDTDGDLWRDDSEVFRGSDPRSASNHVTSCYVFFVKLQYAAPTGAGGGDGKAVLRLGPLSIPVSASHPVLDRPFFLPDGIAHKLRLLGAKDDRGGALSTELFSGCAYALYDPDGILGPGLPPGTNPPFAAAFLAFVGMDVAPSPYPLPICVHTPAHRRVRAAVSPNVLVGAYEWSPSDDGLAFAVPVRSQDGAAEIVAAFPANESRSMALSFVPDARPALTFPNGTCWTFPIVQCVEALPDEPPPDDWGGESGGWTPAAQHADRTFVGMNSDDDDFDGVPDHQDVFVAGENDLLPISPNPHHSGCCACPEHASEPPPVVSLAGLTSGVRLWPTRERTEQVAVGSSIAVGQTLYLEGTGGSDALGDKRLWWHVNDRVETNCYTVLRLQLQPDLDGDADVDAADRVLRRNVSPAYGVPYGVAPGRFHRIDLRTDGNPSGDYELTLFGPQGAFRLWANRNGTGQPLLVSTPEGATLAAGCTMFLFWQQPSRTVWLECLSAGGGELRYRYLDPDGVPRMGETLRLGSVTVDVDVDSANDSEFDEQDIHQSASEDVWEDVADPVCYVGRIIVVDDDDKDGDGIPDFADGYNLLPDIAASVENGAAQFVPIIFELPESIDLARARVRLTYSDSAPLAVTANADGSFSLPEAGKLRLWRRPGNEARNGDCVLNGGDFLPSLEYSAAEFGFVDGVRRLVYFVESVGPSEAVADLRIVFEVEPDEGGGFMAEDAVRLTAVRLRLTPDFNRDGKIDDADAHRLSSKGMFRFWYNDDRDTGEFGTAALEDGPEGSYLYLPDHDWYNVRRVVLWWTGDYVKDRPTNCSDNKVNGVRDLVDFLPVRLDIPLRLLGAERCAYQLKQPDGAVNFAYTDLDPANTGRLYTNRIASGFGPARNQPADAATTERVTAGGVELNFGWLEASQVSQNTVLMIEGRNGTRQPLVLELRRDKHIVGSWAMGLSVSSVGDMFRYLNVRTNDTYFSKHHKDGNPITFSGPGACAAKEGKWPTRLDDPVNCPDGFYGEPDAPQKTLVVVHGLDWDESETPAGHSEIFKRLFQSGLAARYVGVSWASDMSRRLDSPLVYGSDVIGAFIAAKYVNDGLADFLGPHTTVLAHSLGNVLVSSAINDYGMSVGKYILLNAAVPVESYDGRNAVAAEDRMNMIEPTWKNVAGPGLYDERVTCAGWGSLFSAGDPRRWLTWDGRFRSVVAEGNGLSVYQFYSTGEEILNKSEGFLPKIATIRSVLSLLSGVGLDDQSVAFGRERVWVYNEMTKGTAALTGLIIANHNDAGWQFSRDPSYGTSVPNGHDSDGQPVELWAPLSAAVASQLTTSALIGKPFFDSFDEGADPDIPGWTNIHDWIYQPDGDPTVSDHLPPVPFADASMDQIKNHAKLLAEVIPPLSGTAGYFASSAVKRNDPNAAVDMNNDEFKNAGEWPTVRPGKTVNQQEYQRWLHGDYKDAPFLLTHKLYEQIADITE